MITINSIKKAYGDHAVLKQLSLQIEVGKTLALLGGNGAGKSTLINILSGLTPFQSGEILYEGISYKQFFANQRNKAKIGIVPQTTSLYDTLTVYQNLMYWGQAYQLTKRAVKDRIRYYLAALELESLTHQKVNTLSIGQQKIVSLLAGILHEPALLFLDEPTVGIDILNKEKIYAFIRELKQRGITIVYTTHNFSEIPKICDQIAILKDGLITDFGTEADLIEKYEIDHRVVVTLAENSFSASDLLLETLALQPFDLNVVDGQHLEFRGKTATQQLAAIISTLNEAGLSIRNVQVHQPSLENIFIQAYS